MIRTTINCTLYIFFPLFICLSVIVLLLSLNTRDNTLYPQLTHTLHPSRTAGASVAANG